MGPNLYTTGCSSKDSAASRLNFFKQPFAFHSLRTSTHKKILTTLTFYIILIFKKKLTIILHGFCQDIYMKLLSVREAFFFILSFKKAGLGNPAFSMALSIPSSIHAIQGELFLPITSNDINLLFFLKMSEYHNPRMVHFLTQNHF